MFEKDNRFIKYNLIAGLVAGYASIVICHPFDVIRTKYQYANRLPKPFELYNGFLFPFLAQGVYKSTIFSTNSACQNFLSSYSKNDNLNVFLSGCFAGSINSFIVTPIEIIRTSSIVHGSKLTFFKLWRCIIPTLLRDGPGMGFYFLTFNIMKKTMGLNLNYEINNRNQTSIRILAGAMAGITFWAWALPLDNLKTNMEATFDRCYHLSPIQHLNIVWKLLIENGGLKRFYRGWSAAYGRGMVAAAVTLTTYDSCMDYFETV
jgi:solute carrier family 25 carnitine/acylcarnitine transporter 20/29